MEYLRRVASLSESYSEDLLDCSNTLNDFLKATEYEKSKMQTQLMLLLMKYKSKSNFMHKVENIEEMLKKNEDKMRLLIEEMEQIRRNKLLKCPHCDGMGGRMTIKITRDDWVLTPHMVRTACPVCNGTGTLTISKDLEDQVGLFIRILRSIMKSERMIRETIRGVVNSLRNIY